MISTRVRSRRFRTPSTLPPQVKTLPFTDGSALFDNRAGVRPPDPVRGLL